MHGLDLVARRFEAVGARLRVRRRDPRRLPSRGSGFITEDAGFNGCLRRAAGSRQGLSCCQLFNVPSARWNSAHQP